MATKPKYTIAVTGLNAIDSPGPGVPVIRSLRDAESFDVRIIGLSYETLEPGIYLHDLVDKTYQLPYPSAGMDALMERLAYIQSKEKIDFLFPNFDAELFNYIKNQHRIEQDLGIKMVLPTVDQFEARHKVNLFEYGQKHEVSVPVSHMIFSTAEIENRATELGYPLVVKGKFYDAKVAYTKEEAIQHFHKISAQWGLPIILQQFLRGSEVNVCGAGDGKGNLIGAVAMRKLYITDKGKAWSGITIEDDELMAITKKLVGNSRWTGPFELEFMKTTEGTYYLIEINPRFPAWCYLAVGAGQNQAESLVNLAMGNEYKCFDSFEVGKMFVRYAFDLIVDIKEFEQISTIGEL
jgi:carbamoyl-phosphate synthase large subunit